jgi:hypothetical protein
LAISFVVINMGCLYWSDKISLAKELNGSRILLPYKGGLDIKF